MLKKQENSEEKNQSIKTNSKLSQMLLLSDKDNKTVITMLHMFENIKKRHGRYKLQKIKIGPWSTKFKIYYI